MIKDIVYEEKLKKEKKEKGIERTCKCGWKNKIKNRHGRMICPNCGNYVFLNKKDEFINKLKNEIGR